MTSPGRSRSLPTTSDPGSGPAPTKTGPHVGVGRAKPAGMGQGCGHPTRTFLLAVGMAMVAGAGCTPEQVALAHWFNRDPATPVPCREWVGASRAAGFTDDQLPTIHRIMWRESRCNPTAHNPSGATGLVQVMPMWADDCGITPADLFTPQANMDCAALVYAVQGWDAWSTWP